MSGSIPPATVARLPVYLRCLAEIPDSEPSVSSNRLAELAGVNAAQVRKDLSYLRTRGVRGVGYDVLGLRAELARILGTSHQLGVVIVGAGNLGTALSTYGGFRRWGFTVEGVFDVAADRVGAMVGGHVVRSLSELHKVVAARDVAIGIIATPAGAAQHVADLLVSSGIRSILNLAPVVLQVPDRIEVRRVDLSTELQILSFPLRSRVSHRAR